MKLKDRYDWIVLGDHPGALLSGCLAAKLGLTVLILPFAPRQQVSTPGGGRCLDPETNLLSGLRSHEKEGGLLYDTLTQIGVSAQEIQNLRSGEAAVQVLTPESRVNLGADSNDLQQNLDEMLGEAFRKRLGVTHALHEVESSFSKFWKQFPDQLRLPDPKEKRKLKHRSYQDLLRALTDRSAKLKKSTDKRWLSWSSKLEGDSVSSQLLLGAHHAACGSATSTQGLRLPELLHDLFLVQSSVGIKGGLSAYRALLLRQAERLGAQVPQGTECRRVFVQSGRFSGVQAAHQGSMISATGGVLGCSILHAKEKIHMNGRHLINRLKPTPKGLGWKFSLAVTLSEEAIPPGMSSHLVWREPGAPSLEIELASPSDYGLGQSQHQRMVFLRTLLPYTQSSLDIRSLRLTASRMLRQLEEILPFLQEHLIRVYPEFRGDAEELSQVYGFTSPDMIPENLRLASGSGLGARSGVEGLFLATSESYPRLGNFGGLVAALEATAWLAHRSGLRGPLN